MSLDAPNKDGGAGQEPGAVRREVSLTFTPEVPGGDRAAPDQHLALAIRVEEVEVPVEPPGTAGS